MLCGEPREEAEPHRFTSAEADAAEVLGPDTLTKLTAMLKNPKAQEGIVKQGRTCRRCRMDMDSIFAEASARQLSFPNTLSLVSQVSLHNMSPTAEGQIARRGRRQQPLSFYSNTTKSNEWTAASAFKGSGSPSAPARTIFNPWRTCRQPRGRRNRNRRKTLGISHLRLHDFWERCFEEARCFENGPSHRVHKQRQGETSAMCQLHALGRAAERAERLRH